MLQKNVPVVEFASQSAASMRLRLFCIVVCSSQKRVFTFVSAWFYFFLFKALLYTAYLIFRFACRGYR